MVRRPYLILGAAAGSSLLGALLAGRRLRALRGESPLDEDAPKLPADEATATGTGTSVELVKRAPEPQAISENDAYRWGMRAAVEDDAYRWGTRAAVEDGGRFDAFDASVFGGQAQPGRSLPALRSGRQRPGQGASSGASLRSGYARRPDLTLTVAASVVCALVAGLVPYVPVRILATVPLALVLPGYAIVSAVFVRTELSVALRLALVPSMSLATLVIGALVIDLAPGGLNTLTWALWIILVTVAACSLSADRTPFDYVQPVEFDPRRLAAAVTGGGKRAGSGIAVVVAAGVAIAALVVSRMPLSAPNSIGYTQLYLFPSGVNHGEVQVGVESDQLNPARYRLVVRAPGRHRHTLTFGLRPGQTKLVTARVGTVGNVTATLFLDGRSGSYREVTLNRAAAGAHG